MEKTKYIFTRINQDDNHRDIVAVQSETDFDAMQRWLNVNYNTDDKVELMFRAKNKLISKSELNPFVKDCKFNLGINEVFEWQPSREKWVKINIESMYDLNFPV